MIDKLQVKQKKGRRRLKHQYLKRGVAFRGQTEFAMGMYAWNIVACPLSLTLAVCIEAVSVCVCVCVAGRDRWKRNHVMVTSVRNVFRKSMCECRRLGKLPMDVDMDNGLASQGCMCPA